MPPAVASMVAPLTNRLPPTPEIGSGCPACQSIDVVLPSTWTDVIVAPPTPRSAVVTGIGIGRGGLAVVGPLLWRGGPAPPSRQLAFARREQFCESEPIRPHPAPPSVSLPRILPCCPVA